MIVYNIHGTPIAQIPDYYPIPAGLYKSPVDASIARGDNPSLRMMQASPGSVLQHFYHIPGYELAFGAFADQQDPTTRFKFEPGYDFAMQEGMRELQRQGAARGLLESGPMQRELLKFSQGMADQNYQRWLGQQMGVWEDYQNRLANLTQFGSEQTGNQNAFNLGQGLSQTSAAASNAALNTGSNLSSLFGNQGVFGGSSYLNTGAGQSNNLMNALALQAQIAQANQQASLQSQAYNQSAQLQAQAYNLQAMMGSQQGGGGGGGGGGGAGSLLSGVGSLLGAFF